MDALLTVVALWLSANFNLPASLGHPAVKFVQPSHMAVLRYETLAPFQKRTGAVIKFENTRKLVALYDNRNKIIYLSDRWTGRTVADTSVIVHEMVHHLQHVAGLQFSCPAEREKLAYEAQAKWLALFGRNLESEFQIDRLTTVLTTSCAIGMNGPF